MCSLNAGKKLSTAIKVSDVHVIKNCGHMMHLEEADKVLVILKKFIIANFPS
jgi:pimeloyl-ACP methyl ester carboxylesterase